MPDYFHLQWRIYRACQPREWWYGAKHLVQRMRRGWSDQDAWNLDYHTAAVIADGVDRLREVSLSHPADLSFAEWQDTLTKISKGFRIWAERPALRLNPEDKEAYVEAKRLFALWHHELWW